MPTSDAWGKDWLSEHIQNINERASIPLVTDVGAGEGTYHSLLSPVLPTANWLAVEVWGPYVSEYSLNDKYDTVVVADMQWVDPCVFNANLVIFGDVIEHVSKSSAMAVVESALAVGKTSKHSVDRIISICIPVLHLEQEAVNGNPFEIHRMENHWTCDEMEEFLREMMDPGDKLDMHVGDVVAYFVLRTGRYANAL